MKRKIRAAIYSRVSTKDQIERTEYDSMQSHLDRCKHYIQAQDNWELVKVYEDPAESGDKFRRPKLQEMLSDVRLGEIDIVVTIRMDRISRSVRDFHEILKILEENDVSLVSVTQGIDTSTPAGKLLRNILIDFAQFERDMISDRTKEKRLARAKKGYWNGGMVPYGYKSVDKKLVIVPDEAEAIRFIYDNYFRTKSMATARKELELKGVRTRAGKKWAKSTIHRILSNPIYAGKINENGEYYDGQHEAIVDPDLFFKVQKTVPKIIKTPKTTDRVFLLRGLVKCGHHKCSLTPYFVNRRKSRTYYYHCVKKQNYRNTKCPVGYTNADEIEKYVIGKLKELSKDTDVFERIVEQVNLDIEKETPPYKKDLEEVDNRIRELNSEIANYIDAIGKSGSKVIDLIEKKVEVIQYEISELEKRKGELELLVSNSPSKIDSEIVLNALKDFSELFETFRPVEQAEYLQRIIRDVVVTDKTLKINIFGLANPPKGASKDGSVWLPSTDSNRGPSG